MIGYLEQDQTHMMLVYDALNGDRVKALILKQDIDRSIEALKGQGCPYGVWSLQSWEKVKDYVLSENCRLD